MAFSGEISDSDGEAAPKSPDGDEPESEVESDSIIPKSGATSGWYCW